MDLLTIGFISAAILIVSAACFVIYKLLSRETTFEEAYGDNALKLLTAQFSTEKVNNKPKSKRPKRKQSPKQEKTRDKSADSKTSEPKVKPAQNEEKIREKSKKVEKENSSSPLPLVEDIKQREEIDLKSGTNIEKEIESRKNLSQNDAKEKTEEQQLHIQKKGKKQVFVKDLSLSRTVDRLKEIGELETEYITFLQNSMDDVKAKETKLRNEIKSYKSAKDDSDKKLKQTLDDLENLHAEKNNLMKEKKEQNERHLIFEQTVRAKLVETHQLKEENKKLMDELAQARSKFVQTDQFVQKAQIMQTELTKVREESALNKKYAENLVNESAKLKKDAEDALHNTRMGYEERMQTLQAELNKEREQRLFLAEECRKAKSVVDKMIAERANNENQLMEAANHSKSSYEGQLQALQNELNREKDHHMQVMRNAQNQIGELTNELEKAVLAYQNLVYTQNAEAAKIGELSTRNKELEAELSVLKSQSKLVDQSSSEINALESTIVELNKNIEDQKRRNQDLRDANYKLMENIKNMNQNQPRVNGVAGDGHVDEEKLAQMDRLAAENRNYKLTLDSVNKQLEKVSRIAEEMEREKDARIAQLEKLFASP